MTWEMLATGAALAAALLHAGWNTLVKQGGGDRLTTLATLHAAMLVVSLPGLAYASPMAPAAWPWLLATALVHTVYKLFLLQAYRHGDLSHVYPIARGTSPLLIAVGAWLVIGEAPGLGGWLGLFVLSAGILSLSLPAIVQGAASRSAVLFALATAAMIATYTVLDGIGARLSGSVLGFLCWLSILDGVLFVGYARWRRGPELWRGIWQRRVAWVGGVSGLAGYGLVLWAMTVLPMATVSALRETSVIFAALLGATLLKERFGWGRAVSVLLVAGGAAAMRLA